MAFHSALYVKFSIGPLKEPAKGIYIGIMKRLSGQSLGSSFKSKGLEMVGFFFVIIHGDKESKFSKVLNMLVKFLMVARPQHSHCI